MDVASTIESTHGKKNSSLGKGKSTRIPPRTVSAPKKPSRCTFCNTFGEMSSQGLRRHTFGAHYAAVTLLDNPENAIAQFEIGNQICGQAGEYMKYRAFYNLLKKLGAVDELPPHVNIINLKGTQDVRALAIGDIPIRDEVLKPVEQRVFVESEPPVVRESEEDLFALLTAPLPTSSAAGLPSDLFDKDVLLDISDGEFSALDFTDPVESHDDFDEAGSDFENHCDEFHEQ